MEVGPPAHRRVVMLVRNAYTHDTRVEKEASTLAEAGYEVIVVADGATGLPRRETRQGTRVVRVPRTGPRVPGLSFVVHEVRLAGVLRDLNPDVLHAHDSNALLPVAFAARSLRVPFVYDAHELWLHRPARGHGRLYARLFAMYYQLVHRWAIPRAARTLTVSSPIARHLARSYKLPSVAIVPNYPELRSGGVDDALGAERPLHSLDPKRIPPGAPIVLHLGGMMAERGLEQLVEAVAAVPETHLVFLGAGEQWSQLASRAERIGISSRVHRVGPVASDEVISYASSATMGVVATSPAGLNNRYSLPNKLFQYMAASIPVIASNFSQIQEVVEGAACGYVVDTTRPEAIADAIVRLLANPTAAAEMGERGLQAIEDRYNWSTSAAELRRIYAELPGE